MEITQDYLCSRFFVVDGVLHRKISTGEIRAMDSYGELGYVRVKVCGRVVYAHRIIFLMHNGFLPEYVDHIDGNTKNNDPLNLRAASASENACNRRLGSSNKTGHKNVNIDKKSGLYRVQVWKDGVPHRGFHSDIESAANHAAMLRESLHLGFARHK